MKQQTSRLTVRSVRRETHIKLAILRRYTRLTFGSIIDDAVEALWEAYIEDGHEIVDDTSG
ncbi:hypothetical protein JM93_03865 [Roseibium hamelinense]|uniref:Uncharacterized protein n=1 Tax=Roseibium hamelinense TaxID=150831 RepID=A0A562SLA0_9HYPH|nr:hypothetical protein JM93_03865 [Roseibium hamelinense]